jgi:hypothetical protein
MRYVISFTGSSQQAGDAAEAWIETHTPQILMDEHGARRYTAAYYHDFQRNALQVTIVAEMPDEFVGVPQHE